MKSARSNGIRTHNFTILFGKQKKFFFIPDTFTLLYYSLFPPFRGFELGSRA